MLIVFRLVVLGNVGSFVLSDVGKAAGLPDMEALHKVLSLQPLYAFRRPCESSSIDDF
jgi:hypothetical protein